MKRSIPIGTTILLSLSLLSCAYNRSPFPDKDLTQEKWRQEVDTNSSQWAAGADRWFLSGDANSTELADRNAPFSAAISTMMVRVPDFTNVEVNGAFEVQLFGTYEHNSVYLYGPNDAVRNVVVNVKNNQLCINEAKGAPRSMKRVIVRIGVRHLNQLNQLGCGLIEGIQLRSAGLDVMSSGSGDIYLAGPVNVKHILKIASGSLSMFGVATPSLEINTSGRGSVNVSGNVGVTSITHHGTGDINIVGANTNGLKIYADGSGKIGLSGHANLKDVQARGATRVYLNQSNSDTIYAYAYDKARIGVAGGAGDLYVYTAQSARFEGRYLCAQNGFSRAGDYSHINVTATNKMFASATGNASVYFFGTPKLMSQFVSNNGVVVPIWSNDHGSCGVATAQPIYKD